MSFETGAASTAKLSSEIRRGLSDAGLCVLNSGMEACSKVIDGEFLRIPTEQDLKVIERLESHAGEAENAAKLRALRKDILRE